MERESIIEIYLDETGMVMWVPASGGIPSDLDVRSVPRFMREEIEHYLRQKQARYSEALQKL